MDSREVIVMWDWNYVWDILPQLLSALKMTVWVTICAFAVALVIGLRLLLRRGADLRCCH